MAGAAAADGEAASTEAPPGELVTAGEEEEARRTSWVVATSPGLRGGEGERVIRRPCRMPSAAKRQRGCQAHDQASIVGLAREGTILQFTLNCTLEGHRPV